MGYLSTNGFSLPKLLKMLKKIGYPSKYYKNLNYDNVLGGYFDFTLKIWYSFTAFRTSKFLFLMKKWRTLINLSSKVGKLVFVGLKLQKNKCSHFCLFCSHIWKIVPCALISIWSQILIWGVWNFCGVQSHAIFNEMNCFKNLCYALNTSKMGMNNFC